jgi:hypothetical protein
MTWTVTDGERKPCCSADSQAIEITAGLQTLTDPIREELFGSDYDDLRLLVHGRSPLGGYLRKRPFRPARDYREEYRSMTK